MSSSYSELHVAIKEVNERLDTCSKTLEGIDVTERDKYQNPQYRTWSGNIKDLEEFTSRLEEWLSQPSVAEAKRYLLDFRKWSESVKEVSVDELERDWRFLSDNVNEIGNIYEELESIEYDAVKHKTSAWVLERIVEKDLERAENWASNARIFSLSLKQLDDQELESGLATAVRGDAVEELLKVSSFDTDNSEALDQYEGLVEVAENMVKNKPAEIEEKAILKTYHNHINKGIREGLSTTGTKLEEIRNILIALEWVKEFTGFKGYGKIWADKQAGARKSDLERVVQALLAVQEKAGNWKADRERELGSALTRTERMSKSIEKNELKRQAESLRQESQTIDWNKPGLQLLFETLDKTNKLQKELRKELVEKLRNEDAITIIEEPEIIKDLGGNLGWDFERFIRALEIVLRNGLIEIKAIEEK